MADRVELSPRDPGDVDVDLGEKDPLGVVQRAGQHGPVRSDDCGPAAGQVVLVAAVERVPPGYLLRHIAAA